jgi:response regulator RpfG family c-di-GMP phosphodiesterase
MTERTLLLVDDEENVVSSLNRLLRRNGYRILQANSGKEGLEILASNSVGVIISDQRMPGMTGVEFLNQVKDKYPDTVRIVLSGYTELNSVTDAINRGAIYKFLTKPWDDDLLRNNVEEAFRRYEMERENVRLSNELQNANAELLRINHQLEQQVEEKTHEALLNLDVLLVSQEILEHLPIAVIGIADDGMIAVANKIAHQLFCTSVTQTLLGEEAQAFIPAELLKSPYIPCSEQNGAHPCLRNGIRLNCWSSVMSELSQSKGRVLVVDPEIYNKNITI